MDREPIIVVSGLPRSGTSLMMKMLQAGGLDVLTDERRRADADNPKGYFEYEAVKALAQAHDWLSLAHGKAVKIISALLPHLPSSYEYRVIFMQRSMSEILASQKQMLLRRGEKWDEGGDAALARLFVSHLQHVEAWLGKQRNINVHYISYNEVMQSPADHVTKLDAFLGGGLDVQGMLAAVDVSLYRQRRQGRV